MNESFLEGILCGSNDVSCLTRSTVNDITAHEPNARKSKPKNYFVSLGLLFYKTETRASMHWHVSDRLSI